MATTLQQAQERCPKFSAIWLVAINFLWFIIGIVFIGLASWGINNEQDNTITAALPAGGLKLFVAIGVFLVLTAIAGWIGVKFNYSCCGRVTLGIYATVLIFLMLLEFIAAGTVISFTNKLNDFGPALLIRDIGVYTLVNQSYINCCCSYRRCPNGTCWLPANLLYPCDSIATFSEFLEQWISGNLVPICVVAILIAFLQFFTAITACCNQCRGRTVQAAMKVGAPGPVSYDGLYEGEESYAGAGYGYESYVKGGQPRPGSVGSAAAGGKPAAAGATAPAVPPKK